MSEVKSRSSAPRGRGSGRGTRGGYSSRGGRGGTRQTNGDKPDVVEISNNEDEGELAQLKKLHATKLSTMKEMFPDWTDEDLVFALQETEGNLEQTIDRISDGMSPTLTCSEDTITVWLLIIIIVTGNITQWGEVKKKNKDRSLSKAKDPTTALNDTSTNAFRGGRNRGGQDGVRGGRGRGSERARGTGRGGRGGTYARADKRPIEGEPSADTGTLDPAGGTTDGIVGGWDQPAETENAMESSWENINAQDAAPVQAAEAAKPSSKPDGTRSWASIFNKPAPAASPPKIAASAPTHEAMVEESIVPAPILPDTEATTLPPLTPADLTSPEVPSTPPMPETFLEPAAEITPSKDELTETNLEQVLDASGPPASATAASTAASTIDPRSGPGSSTPLHTAQQQSNSRPPLGGYATSAYKAAGLAGRSGSYQRKILEQQEAVVMPGKHAMDRTAVQFGSMGLNGAADDLDVDSDREEAETRAQPPQHSPVAPRAALPPATLQQPFQSQPSASEALPAPKPAPGLPPINQQPGGQQTVQPAATDQVAQPTSQSNYSYGQFNNRYGPQTAQQEAAAPAPKAYEPFGQQMQQSQLQYDGHPPISQAPAPTSLQQAQAPMGGYSSAGADTSSYYTSDNQRNAYQNQYANYGQQSQQSLQDAGASQPRIGSAFGASASETAQHSSAAQVQHHQPRYGQAGEVHNSGNSTPNPPVLGTQQQPQTQQTHHMLQQQTQSQAGVQQNAYPYGHPYYAGPYYSGYNQVSNHSYGRDRPMFDDVRRYDEQYLTHNPQFGYGGNHGGYAGGPFGGTAGKQSMYGQPHHGYGMSPQTSYDQHSASPANGTGFGQQQAAPSRDGAASGSLGNYGRSSSAQPAENQQQYSSAGTGAGSFGGMPDVFARGTPGFPSQTQGLGHQQSGQSVTNDESVRSYNDASKIPGGPSPALGQPGGRPGSAANSMQGQNNLAATHSQSQSQQGYSGYPGHMNHQIHGQQTSQYGAGPAALGAHHQSGAQSHQGSGYGAYGASFTGSYYGNNTNRGGWGGNYGAH